MDEFFIDNPQTWMTGQDKAGQVWAFDNGPGIFHAPSGRWIAASPKTSPRALGMMRKGAEAATTAMYHPDHEAECHKAAAEWAVRLRNSSAPRGHATSGEGVGGV